MQSTSSTSMTHISCLFRGTLQSVVVCEGCRRRSCTEQPMWQLALDVPHTGVDALSNARRSSRIVSPRKSAAAAAAVLCDSSGSVSLDELVEQFCAVDQLPPQCYACDHCPSRQNASKGFEIAAFPRVLVVVLKRFSWLSTSGAKIGTRVVRSVSFLLTFCFELFQKMLTYSLCFGLFVGFEPGFSAS